MLGVKGAILSGLFYKELMLGELIWGLNVMACVFWLLLTPDWLQFLSSLWINLELLMLVLMPSKMALIFCWLAFTDSGDIDPECLDPSRFIKDFS